LARYGYGEINVIVHNNRVTMIEISRKIKVEPTVDGGPP
jgi:hypothetical protein